MSARGRSHELLEARLGYRFADPDLLPLRDRADFRRLVADLFDRGFPAVPFAP